MPCRIVLLAMLLAALYPCARCEEIDPDYVEALIAQLGAESYCEREAADRKLDRLGMAALPAIERHEDTKDAELEHRLQRIREILHAELAEDEFLPVLGQLKKPTEIKRYQVHSDGGRKPMVVTGFALQWLADAQSEDGHWDSVKYGAEANADLEQTALAALALLGDNPKTGSHSKNVKRALDWLKNRQRADGAYVASTGAPVDGLGHALAAVAMAEAAGQSKFPEYRQSAQLGVDFSVSQQQMIGGKRGGFGRTAKSQPDLLTTTFFTLQFRNARLAGLKVPHECCEGIAVFIDRLDDKQRRALRFRENGYASPCATLIGCACRMMLGWRREDLEPYFAKAFPQYRGHLDESRPDVLMNYFIELAASQQGEEYAKKFRMHAKASVGFCHLRGELEGSWDPAGVRGGMGRVATTALLTLYSERYRR